MVQSPVLTQGCLDLGRYFHTFVNPGAQVLPIRWTSVMNRLLVISGDLDPALLARVMGF